MKRTPVRELLNDGQAGDRCVAKGWVRTRRDSKGGFSFIELNDGSCFANLQVIAESSLDNYDSDVTRLFPGSSICVNGELVESPGQEQRVELRAESIEVYGHSEPTDYPLHKGRVSFEKLREIAHLRPRTNSFGAVTRVRNALSFATHKFFQDRGFLYIHTPIITASDCEGAGEMFQVTTLDLDNPPRRDDGSVDEAADFFGRHANLTVSGQLAVEPYACSLGDVYTFGPTFRAENSNTARHLAEFWMIEPEIAFGDLNEDAELAEAYIKFMIDWVLNNCAEDMAFFDKRIEKGLIDKLAGIRDSAFERISYTKAVELVQNAGRDWQFPVEWGDDLQTEHERYLTEEEIKSPVVVTDYPKTLKPFYMRVNDDNRTVAAMDVLLPKIGEIIGGSQREERLDVLTARIAECGMPEENYWWYMDLRRFGTIPHAGFGLGFERMVQFCTGMANIRDVIPYPRTPRHAEF
jgi:asparaginyl-tRNA synthetase